jgi:hypothetical protein
MKDTLATLFFGGFIAVVLLMAAIDLSPTSYKNVVDNALKECEKSLPRDQHCKIVALPIDKE